MERELDTNQKGILTAPLDALRRMRGEVSPEQEARLSELEGERTRVRQALKETKAEAQRCSRRIGEAKRHGQAIEPLKEQMSAHSARIKTLKAHLRGIEEETMALLKPPSNVEGTEATARVYRTPSRPLVGLEVHRLDGDTAPWDAYVAQHPAASIYHRAAWGPLIQNRFGHEPYYLLARWPDGGIAGILPLIRLRSRLFGDYMVSMPYVNYGGATADHPEVEKRLMRHAEAIAKDLGLDHIEFRDDLPREGWPARTDKVAMILELPETTETLWRTLGSKLRAQIKRPQREHPEVRRGGIEYLDDFYRVFARNMRDLGTPVYDKGLFSDILHTFPGNARIISVRFRGKPVSAGLLLGHGGTLEIPWASTLREANRLGTNMLLYWEALSYAVTHGYRRFDFGRSSEGSGTYRFKRQWGAQPKPLYWHYWIDGEGELPALNPGNPKYALAIGLWKRLPLGIANRIGPHVVKNLP